MPYQSHAGVAGDSDTLRKLAALRLPDLKGKSFLDVGCNEGFFCGHAHANGAARVVGIDVNAKVVQRAAELYPDCTFLHQSWETLPPGPWDVILHASAMHYAADPYALVRRMHDALADDGLLVLEIGVSPHNHQMESGLFEIGAAFWERANRSFDTVFHPSETLLRSDLLTDFSVRTMGRSVPQKGDPLPRKVYHCRKFRPIVLLVNGEGGAGKTTLAVEMQRHAVATFSSDFVLERIFANSGKNTAALWTQVKNDLQTSNAVPFYNHIANSDLAQAFAAEVCNMMPKRQRVTVLEGYAFNLPRIRELVTNELKRRGFFVYHTTVPKAT